MRTRRFIALALATSFAAFADMGVAHADAVAYLINVTVRPGYNFANAEQALAYGNGICNKTRAGSPYRQLITDVGRDFSSDGDEYQASYLITQAVNELCPDLIWQLRNSAAGYQQGAVTIRVGTPGPNQLGAAI